jgi:hypothetical protein
LTNYFSVLFFEGFLEGLFEQAFFGVAAALLVLAFAMRLSGEAPRFFCAGNIGGGTGADRLSRE